MSFKRIVIISSTSLLEPVTRNRLLPFINILLNKNIKVTLVCPRMDSLETTIPPGLDIKIADISNKKPDGFVRRAIQELLDCASILTVANKEDANGFLVTIPSMFLAFLSPIFLRHKTRFIDVRDLPWEYLSDEKLLLRISKKIFKKAFTLSINSYELVAATNPTELAYIDTIWNKGNKPFLVSNGIMRAQFDKLSNVTLSNSCNTTVTYIGNIGIAQNLETLIFAAQQLPDVSFKIVGSGIQLPKLQELVSSLQLNNVELTGRIPWDEVSHYYDITTILYAQLAPSFSGAMPSKLYEYLATGKYIIYGGRGQASEILSNFENNELIQPCDVDALVKAIRNVRDHKHTELSLKNRELISNNYVRENTAKNFINAIEEFVTLKKP